MTMTTGGKPRAIHIDTDDADDDVTWFADHPERRYRVRPLKGDEQAMLGGAGSYAVITRAGRGLFYRGPMIPNTEEAASLMIMPAANKYRHCRVARGSAA